MLSELPLLRVGCAVTFQACDYTITITPRQIRRDCTQTSVGQRLNTCKSLVSGLLRSLRSPFNTMPEKIPPPSTIGLGLHFTQTCPSWQRFHPIPATDPYSPRGHNSSPHLSVQRLQGRDDVLQRCRLRCRSRPTRLPHRSPVPLPQPVDHPGLPLARQEKELHASVN